MPILDCLTDIFTRVDYLSMSLGKRINILKCSEKLKFFKEKLPMWHRRVKEVIFRIFIFCGNDLMRIADIVREEIKAHLQMISKSFDGYFAAAELKILKEKMMNPYSYS